MIVEGRINDTTESLYEICDRKLWQKIKEMGENEVSGLLDSIAQRFLSLHKFEFLVHLSSGKVAERSHFLEGQKVFVASEYYTYLLDYQ